MLKKLKAKYCYSIILYKELVRTDFKLRYQGSFLGYLWALLKPLFMFTVMYVVFVHFLRIGNDVPHWPAALLSGIMIWSFFSEITNSSVMSIVARGDLIRKINFPKFVIIFASATSAIINLVFCMIVLLVFCFINGVEFGPSALMAPVWILEVFLFAIGIGFILSTVYVKVRDINYIWEIVMQALFYASAVIWPISIVAGEQLFLAKLILLNPVAQAIQSFRYDVIDNANQTLATLTDGAWYWNIIPFAIVLMVFVAGIWIFKKNSPNFAENV